MALKNWPGAKWWKFDFHAHTPASEDYGRGSDQDQLKRRTAREWVLDYMRAGIDCVAVTDHNSGEWIDSLKAAVGALASESDPDYRPLYIFPGVEITVNGGLHLLAVLDPDKGTAEINDLLAVARYRGNRGSCDACTETSPLEVIREIVSAGGLAIPAHADDRSGLFQVLGGTSLDQVLAFDGIIAVEIMDPGFTKPQLYADHKCRWTEVLGSDAHYPTGPKSPSSHYTWVKMSTPSMDGLRLALMDGPLSIKRSDQTIEDPNQHGHLTIESIRVTEAKYMGRGRVFDVQFNPWLNTIIGGRGTGKSSLLEFLRIAFRRQQEVPERIKPELEKYGALESGRQGEGLLTAESLFKAEYRKDETRFLVQWDINGNAEPISEQPQVGGWVAAAGDIRERFPIRVYSQKQIFELARQPMALLKVIDDAPEVGYREWKERWDAEVNRFLALRAKAREIETGIQDASRIQGELDDVKRRLAIFEKTGHAEILKTFQARSRQNRNVAAWEESWTNTGKLIREFAEQIGPETIEEDQFSAQSEPDLALLAEIRKIADALADVKEGLVQVAGKADGIAQQWQSVKAQSAWQAEVTRAEEAYGTLRQQLESEGAGDPAEYGRLVQDRQRLEERLKEIEARRQRLAKIQDETRQSLDVLGSIRKELTVQRSKFLENILNENPYVSINVIPFGGRDMAKAEFRELINRSGGGFEKDIGEPGGEGFLGVLYESYPDTTSGDDTDFDQMISVFENKLKAVKVAMKSIAKGAYPVAQLRDKRFADSVAKLPPENLDRLDCWFPEDSLDVRYSAQRGGAFQPVQQGSPGQKTAALLAFILSYGDEPLILDQPEDDLDNNLIYNLIVTQLREMKQRRQVIVVTHNANIVVNGDSELVVALDVRHGQTCKICEGSLQESIVRAEICNIMEGGETAFDERYRRIKAGGRHV